MSDKILIVDDDREIREGRFCRRCGARLAYRFYHYSQLGDYACPKCGFSRPSLDYNAREVKVGDQISFRVGAAHIVANYRGFYNVYNILAAYAAGKCAGLSLEHFNQMLKDFHPENGRMESFRIRDTAIVLNLPSMGKIMYDALIDQDMYLAGSWLFLMAIVTVIGTFISDVLLAWLDPRARKEYLKG